jgi:hypothetical protein
MSSAVRVLDAEGSRRVTSAQAASAGRGAGAAPDATALLSRRSFLRRLAVTAAGLYVADESIEVVRRFWPGADFGGELLEGFRRREQIEKQLRYQAAHAIDSAAFQMWLAAGNPPEQYISARHFQSFRKDMGL